MPDFVPDNEFVLQPCDVFRRVTHMDRYPICSWQVAHAFKAAGEHVGVPPGAANPVDIWDFVDKEKDKYVQVRDRILIPHQLPERATVLA